jgi:O-antigen/teichoic acid export membrane protein
MQGLVAGVSRLISNITPLFLLFVFTKTSSLSDIGLINYFIALITIIGVLTDFGLPEVVQSFLPKNLTESKEKNKQTIISKTFFYEILIVAISALGIFILDIISGYDLSKGFPYLLFAIILFSSSNVFIIIFNGLKKDKFVSAFYLGSSILFILISLILNLGFKASATESFLYGRLVSWIVFTIIPVFYLFKGKLVDVTTLDSSSNRDKIIPFAFNAFLASIAYVIAGQLDSILVTQSYGLETNGIFKSAVFAGTIPIALATILQTKLIPEFSENISDAWNLLKKNVKMILMLSGGLLVAGLIFGNLGLTILYNQEIANGGYWFFVAALVSTLINIINAVVFAYYYGVDKSDLVRNITIFETIVYCIVALLTIHNLQLFVLTNVITNFGGLLLSTYYLRTLHR